MMKNVMCFTTLDAGKAPVPSTIVQHDGHCGQKSKWLCEQFPVPPRARSTRAAPRAEGATRNCVDDQIVSLSLHRYSFILHTSMKKSVPALFIAFADGVRFAKKDSDYTKNLVFCIMQEISNLDVRPYTPLNLGACEHLTHQNCKLGRACSHFHISVSNQQTCPFKFHVRRQLTEIPCLWGHSNNNSNS